MLTQLVVTISIKGTKILLTELMNTTSMGSVMVDQARQNKLSLMILLLD